MLLAAGAAVDVRDCAGVTPLIHAARIGRFDLVDVLLKAGANPKLQDDGGETVTSVAVAERAHLQAGEPKWKAQVIESLAAQGVDIEAERKRKPKPPKFPVPDAILEWIRIFDREYGRPSVRASDYFADKGVATLAQAARDGDIARIDELAATGIDVNAKSAVGLNAFVLTPAIFCVKGSPEGFRRLLELGADPNLQCDIGLSPISLAAGSLESEPLRLALRFGGDPNLVNPVFRTAGDFRSAPS